jgi:hypothetical protein
MKRNKSYKPTKRDKASQEKIEEYVRSEKIELNHPEGKERFECVLENAKKQKKLMN